ncbi:hypothetical protein BDZ97DRAFT_1915369 [Flammula alnicola]|nr:hypothetical protein BDZ97DRAFT_1915369 [Flammula alnicola]
MAEPFAAGVLSSLLLPRANQGNVLARVARSSRKHPSLAANFFTPVPRQCKRKEKEVDMPPVGHVLDCQAWACPPSKHSLWCQDGSMRCLLLGEIAAPRRVRRISKSNRSRLHKSLAPEKERGIRQPHVSYSTSSKVVRDYGPPRSELEAALSLSADDQPVASTSSAKSIPLDEFRGLFKQKEMAHNLDEFESAFTALEESGAFRSATFHDLLDFAELLAHHIDVLCADRVSPEIVSDWGQRLLKLHPFLYHRRASSSTSFLDSDKINSVLSRSYAFMGSFDQAEDYLLNDSAILQGLDYHYLSIPSEECDPRSFQSAFTSCVLSISAHKDIFSALEYVFIESNAIESTAKRKQKPKDTTTALFEDPTFVQLLCHDDIRRTIYATEKWDPLIRALMVEKILSTFNANGVYMRSWHLIREMRDRSMECPPSLLVETCRGLASIGRIDQAHQLFASIPPNADGYDALAQSLPPPRTKPPDKRGTGLDAPPLPIWEFEASYPKGSNGLRRETPSFRTYNAVLRFLVNTKDYRGMDELLQDMKMHGVDPDLPFFTMMINAYKYINDADRIFDTFEEMRRAGIKGDPILYTSMFSWLAKRMDSRGANALYEQAIAEGCVPDAYMINALMFVHVRAGAWQEVIRIFHELKAAPQDQPLPIGVYNVMLKAYLLCGAPFRTISKLFFKLEEQGVVPDKYTYSILIQSALSAGQSSYANGIYLEMKKKEEEEGVRLIDITVLTLLMSGYLRCGRKKFAKDMFDEMTSRGLRPNAITYGSIARAYGSKGTREGMKLAEEFIKKVHSDPSGDQSWQAVSKNRKAPLVSIFGPLVAARAGQGDVLGAERAYSDFLQAGGEPSIGLFKSLLAVYHANNQLDKVLGLWPHIMKLAADQQVMVINEGVPGKETQTKMGLINVPLSIYTQAASKAGLHAKVAAAWKELQGRGHEFDEGNWNHYAIACVRAGQLENAFEIMERILLPNFQKSLVNQFTPSPDLDMSYEEKFSYLEGLHSVPPTRPLNSEGLRIRAAAINRSTTKRKTQLTDDEAINVDFSYPLQALQKIGPSWHNWKPTEEVLRALLISVIYLEDGYPIRPLQQDETSPYGVSTDLIEDRAETDPLLTRLFENYPITMKRLRRFKNHEVKDMGKRAFRSIYVRHR